MNVFTVEGPDPQTQLPAFFSDITKGLEFVFDRRNTFGTKKIAAVNMSLGGGGPLDENCNGDMPFTGIIKQLKNRNIATVIASGNDFFTNGVSLPGCISHAVTVGSTEKDDDISSFSNMGKLVDLMAPGTSIQSSVTPNGFDFASGTSMAAPHVAGAFAALRTLHKNATVDEITDALKATGKPIADDRFGGVYTRRRIRLPQANDALGSAAAVATVNAPAVISVERVNANE